MLHNLVGNITDDLRSSVETCAQLCAIIDTPRSLAVSMLIANGEWEQYLDLSIDPSTYEDPEHFAQDYLVTEILRKHPDIPLGVDKALVALEGFKLSEARCFSSNIRLRQERRSWQHDFARNVARILGPLTTGDLNYVERSFDHGPGATTGVRGIGSCLSDKYDKPIHTTVGLLPFFRTILGDLWWEHQKKTKVVDVGNKFTSVPKSAKTERGICVEPTLNMYVQKGIGKLLRSKLRGFGLNLNTQTRNQLLAQRAYSCELATIDLSAASDSLCTEVVLQHFPERWVHLLELCRSPFCTFPNGEVRELEKWSSMGNGYTFELETLVFYALCMTFIPLDEMHNVSVYGDDIIVPRKYAPVLIEALDFFGFKVNSSKSFLAGNFFESCGSDYFKGVNVRPFYLKGQKGFWYLQVANKLRLWAWRIGHFHYCPQRFLPLWESLRMKIPRAYRKLKVPPSFGDTGLISSFDEAKPRRLKNGLEGFAVRHLVTKSVRKDKRSFGVALSAYARTGSGSRVHPLLRLDETLPFSYGRETVRGFVRRPVTKWAFCYYWPCGLDWF